MINRGYFLMHLCWHHTPSLALMGCLSPPCQCPSSSRKQRRCCCRRCTARVGAATPGMGYATEHGLLLVPGILQRNTGALHQQGQTGHAQPAQLLQQEIDVFGGGGGGSSGAGAGAGAGPSRRCSTPTMTTMATTDNQHQQQPENMDRNLST